MSKSRLTFAAKAAIYIIGFALILATSGLLVSYAQGYRYDFTTKSVTRTGLIIVDAQPLSARVSLNNELSRQLTPTKFAGLLPGLYDLKVEKNNFRTWAKRVTVEEGLLSDYSSLWLLPENLIEESSTMTARLIKPSPDRNRLAIVNTDETGRDQVLVWNFNQTNPTVIATTSSSALSGFAISDVAWSLDNQNILVTGTQADTARAFVTNVGGASPVLIDQSLTTSASALIMDPTNANFVYILQTGGELTRQNLATHDRTIIAEYVRRIESTPSELLLISQVNDVTALSSLNHGSQKLRRINDTLPLSIKYDLLGQTYRGREYLVVVAVEAGEVVVIGPSETKTFHQAVHQAIGFAGGQYFLLLDSTKVTTVDLERFFTYETKLSQPISSASWTPDNKHLLLNLSGKAVFMDYDGNYQQELGQVQASSGLIFSARTKAIYFIKPTDKAPGTINSWSLKATFS